MARRRYSGFTPKRKAALKKAQAASAAKRRRSGGAKAKRRTYKQTQRRNVAVVGAALAVTAASYAGNKAGEVGGKALTNHKKNREAKAFIAHQNKTFAHYRTTKAGVMVGAPGSFRKGWSIDLTKSSNGTWAHKNRKALSARGGR